MKLSIKHLRLNETTLDYTEVPEGAEFGFWRVVEHTGAGWFPWGGTYETREAAEAKMKRAIERDEQGLRP